MMTVTSLLLAAGLIYLGGLIAWSWLIAMAPEGYQDENGFHIGTQPFEGPAGAAWGIPGVKTGGVSFRADNVHLPVLAGIS